MNNGRTWGVPAEIIADDRAKYYAEKYKDHDTTYQKEFDTMMEWFDDGDDEFADWAKNNMHWDDVKKHAVLFRHKVTPDDCNECWMNGEYEYKTIG